MRIGQRGSEYRPSACAGRLAPPFSAQLQNGGYIGVSHCWPVKGSTDRWYKYDETGEQAPGVSSVIDVIRKPKLEEWKINNVSVYAVSHLGLLSTVREQDEDAAVSLVKGSAYKAANKKADRGTEVHGLCEQTMRAVMVGKKPRFKATPDDLLYLRNFARWIKEFQVIPIACELAMWSKEYAYAGRLDLLCWLNIGGEWVRSIVDYKTGASGVWPEAAIQQTAYKYADHHIDDSGKMAQGWPVTTFPDTDQPIEGSPDRAFALWLRPDGKALIPLDTSEETWEEFLRRRESYEWQLKVQPKIVGKAINENPLVRKWTGWKK